MQKEANCVKSSNSYRVDELPDLLTLDEVGQFINYGTDLLRTKAMKGEFPAFKVFSEWRIWKKDLINWLEELQRKD